ncbi:MAG: inositol monophosphatase [Syntrophobacteraceae bacterium]|jgi:myo-inositol-1(or 4)-monophosphatase|nr:inositol monophosphatase [Syntrophobacteraceae bacterium]
MLEAMEQVAHSAILEAGKLIRERIGRIGGNAVFSKGPSDFVTEVDRASEALIIEAIQGRYPHHHILAEESAHGSLGEGITWVIDPLDGTTNFIHGFPFVAVSIGACEDGIPVLGLVLDPLREELFTARRGGGAWLNGHPIRARQHIQLKDALVATGFPFRSKWLIDPYLASFKGIFEQVSGIRRAGAAALDLAYTAAGRVDGFWEPGLAPWDMAAGAVLVTEAGGQVCEFRGGQDYLATGHIIAGSPSIVPFLLDQVQAHLVPATSGDVVD